VVGLDSSIIRSSFEVDDEGRFGFALQLPNSVKIRVEQNGIEQWIGGPGFDEATVYLAQPGETISGIDLVQCGLQVRVESSDPEFGWPTFQFYDPLDQSLLVSARSEDPSDRNIGIANLWPGEYLVEITPGSNSLGSLSWLPQWFDRAATMEEGQTVVLGGAGDIVTLDVVLERGGVISGQVESASGELWYHYMILTPGDEYVTWARRWYGPTVTAFMLSGLPDGQYKVGFVSASISWNFPGPPPAETIWYPGTQDWDEATILTIEDASEVTGIEFEVP
jgi:hypothetical protein